MSENNRNVEEYFDRLDEILADIDNREISLKESFDLYKEGVDLVKKAGEVLTGVEKELIVLEEGSDEDGDK